MQHKMNRRRFIAGGLQLSIGGGALLGLSACGDDSAGDLVCADLANMSSSEASVRRTLNYTEISSDPATICAGCEFFYPPTEAGGCGSCEMFSGKPVNPGGHCDSWSKDA